MCQFLSGVLTKDGRVLVGDMYSHGGIEAGWGIKPDEYREFEWAQDDKGQSLTLRAMHDDDPNVFHKSVLTAKFGSRRAMLRSITEGRTNGSTFHYHNGKRHRDRGPAVIYANGVREYYRNGKLVGLNGAK